MDVGARSLVAEVRRRRPADVEGALQVDLNDGVELLLAHLVEEDVAKVAGIVHHRIDAAEFPAGTRIPTEVDLIRHYDVSRVTIRRAVAALIEEGYLRTRRGSGTYVTDRTVALVCDLDLARPWREQLLRDGHEARSELIDSEPDAELPADIIHSFDGRVPNGPLTFALTVHSVDGIPIGLTESWRTDAWVQNDPRWALPPASQVASQAVVAECFAEVGFATTREAVLLRSYLDIPLIVVHARTRLAASGELAEFAKTSWLGSRVRLAYVRRLTIGEIDIAQTLAHDLDAQSVPTWIPIPAGTSVIGH